jgi:hypothetical protein
MNGPNEDESMNNAQLAAVLREHAEIIKAHDPRHDDDLDTAELVLVLARVVEGKELAKAFGAPGDWGYGTPIGDALAKPPNVALSGAERNDENH